MEERVTKKTLVIAVLVELDTKMSTAKVIEFIESAKVTNNGIEF